MPSTKVRRGLYWSTRTQTWHHEFRFKGAKKNGDTGHSNEKLARQWLKAYKGQLADLEVGLIAAGPVPTLEQAYQQWKAERGPQVGPRARDITRVAIEIHLAAHLKTPLPLLTTPVVNQAIGDYLAQPGHSAGGANVFLRRLRAVVNYALKARRIATFPYDVKNLDVQQVPKRALTPEDLSLLMATLEELRAPGPVLDQVRLIIGLGLRISESCLARVEATDLRRREFTPWDPEAGTKGGEAVALPIPEWLLPHITRMVGQRKEGYLVPGARQEAPSRGVVYRWIVKARVKLQWPWLFPHELRAAYATLLSDRGLGAKAIQTLMRHKDPRTTDLYIRRNLAPARAALDSIGSAMGLTPKPEAASEPEQSLVSPPKIKRRKLRLVISET